MKKAPIITVLVILAAVLVGVGIYLGTKKDTNKLTSTNQATTASTPKQLDLNAVLSNLQKQFPTIQQTYVYSEQRDPNHNLGKSGYYVAGAEFYDGRTNTTPDGYAFGTDSGGAIEVYSNSSDAAKRIAYLQQFQGQAALDPGAFKQVGKIVIRASTNYTKSQQDEVIIYIASQVNR